MSILKLQIFLILQAKRAFKCFHGPFFEYSGPKSSAGIVFFLDSLGEIILAFCKIGGGSVGRLLDYLFLYNMPPLCYFLNGTSPGRLLGFIWLSKGSRGVSLTFQADWQDLHFIFGKNEREELGKEELIAFLQQKLRIYK